MNVGYSITARDPNYLYFVFWLYEVVDDVVKQITDETLKGSIELNEISIVSDVQIGNEGYYEFTLKVHEQKFNSIQSSLGSVKLIIGSNAITINNPEIIYLPNTDKKPTNLDIMKLSKQQTLYTEYPNWPILDR